VKANANPDPKIQRTESHEWPVRPACPEARVVPKSRAFPESPKSLVSPVSEGQANTRKKDEVLKAFGARNACTTKKSEGRRLFQVARDLSVIERGTGRELTITEITPAFQEWHRLSQPFLDPTRTRDDYFAELVFAISCRQTPLSHSIAEHGLGRCARSVDFRLQGNHREPPRNNKPILGRWFSCLLARRRDIDGRGRLDE